MAAQEDILFNFRRDIDKPLDHWDVVATLDERDAIPTGVRYDGMEVFVEGNSTNYQLVGGVWTVPAGGSGQTATQVEAQINQIRTDADTLTFPNGLTFEAGTGGGGDSGDHEFAQQRLDSLGLDSLFLPAPLTPDTATRVEGLKQFEKTFAGFSRRIYYFGRISAGDSRVITGSGFENDVDSFFEAGTADNALVFIRAFIG